ncbi:GTP 3',8-cyclase MoaA [Desulfobotulus sp. H1]|uniref:GTP 3',8-cyclase n=1 Tax=Desulfobotulus pelophilus TaxID=2823377 RepID=A0ABT3NB47_9BACT|nr:GTP 3',8-cyclase MoaA [Desulfobotulus pelophilus]
MTLPLQDGCGRPVTYLRISITDHCNLRCLYCTPEKPNPRLSHQHILRFEEILVIAQTALDMGIRKIRITGGEPLIRKGVFSFLNHLGKLPGLRRLAITTNGVRLASTLNQLEEAGVHQLNISLDTMDPGKFARITGKDCFHTVWEGIERAVESGSFRIKLNAVALRGINEKDFLPLASLARQWPVSVRFIEEMPIGHRHNRNHRPILVPEIRQILEPLGPLSPISSEAEDGPASRFSFPGAIGEIGFIPALSRHFCHNCNRLRLTADGRLRPCLLSDESMDIGGPLRRGVPNSRLQEILRESLKHKGAEHHFNPESADQVDTAMIRIGG